jgi:hypothetical protein
MRRCCNTLTSMLVALAICSASGAHWVLLQSVAWAGMVVTYAQDRPLAEAVSDTFDGQHPCDMCKAIVTGQKEEKQSKSLGLTATTQKVLLYFVTSERALPPDGRHLEILDSADHGVGRRDAPPSPPPRRV